MKKLLTIVPLVAMVAFLTMGVSSCQPEQVKVVAQNAGLFSAVGWIAYDNPTTNEIDAVETILVVIEEKSSDVKDGATFTEALFPEVLKVINADIEAQYKPIAKAGALSLLSGLDMLFASKPEWKSDQDMAVEVVNAFILGAKSGLGMSERDPIMVEARASAQRRIVVDGEIRALRALQD